jgi:Pyruvate/2-oxoacid:ferredoxin oxidoreductase delta subunit
MKIMDAIRLTPFSHEHDIRQYIWDTDTLIQQLEKIGAKRGQSLRMCPGGAFNPVNDDQYPYHYTIGCGIIAEVTKVPTVLTVFEKLRKGDKFFLSDFEMKDATSNYWMKDGRARAAVESISGAAMNWKYVTLVPETEVRLINVTL